MSKTSVEGSFQLNLLSCWRRFAEAPFKEEERKNDMNLGILTVNQSLLSPHLILKKKKKGFG